MHRHPTFHGAGSRRAVVRILLSWVVWSFGLHLLWELAHLPLYTLWQDDNLFRIGGYVVHCTLGDVAIATMAYIATAAIFRRIDWPAHFLLRGAAVLLGIGIAYTAFSEWYNVYQVNAWVYTPQMPLVGGIGVTPMLQWLVVPTLMLWRLRWTTGTRFSASVNAGVRDNTKQVV